MLSLMKKKEISAFSSFQRYVRTLAYEIMQVKQSSYAQLSQYEECAISSVLKRHSIVSTHLYRCVVTVLLDDAKFRSP